MKKFFKTITLAGIITLIFGVYIFSHEINVYALEEDTLIRVEEARAALREVVESKTVMALVYLSDEYPIREEASYDSTAIKNIFSGQQVHIQDVFLDDTHEVWVYVTFEDASGQHRGYIPRTYLACSDQAFLEWENTYGMAPVTYTPFSFGLFSSPVSPDIEAFPESYRSALYELKALHPNWTFVKMNTGLNWNNVITEQMKDGRSLVPNSYPEYMKQGVFGAGWSYAADNILKYYMDPRNALQEELIFQFELLTYNASYHTEQAVQSFLDNTFMKGIGPGTVLTYAKIFWANGAEMGVSPFHLASRVRQEQGQGTSPLISGTYPGFEGYYNYFNVAASGTTNTEIYVNGLAHAKKNNWYNAYFSIRGGAEVISANYILKGQDTLYLQKYNVNPASPYGVHNHQYMQNIVAPTSEGKNIRKLYQDANSLDNTFVFKIPVFENMPQTASPYPTESMDVILTPPSGYTDATIYLDGIPYPAVSVNGKYVVTAKDTSAKTAILYQFNASGVPTGMYVWSLSYEKGVYVATAVPGLENLMTYHGFSIRITGRSGIRFKTGVSASLRASLLAGGVGGYKLKEYGTLIMSDANRSTYPMIKGGEKTSTGMTYGKLADGSLEDIIYETIDGRHRYTAVLVGLPQQQYKTAFAFRGYMVLTKDGKDVVLYGPVMARSIYSLAEQILSMGQYPEGTDAEVFLKKIITDADKTEEGVQ